MLNSGDTPTELVAAFAAMIHDSQAVVESYLKDLAEFSDFRPVPKGVQVLLVENDWSLNAYAEKKDGGYDIGINAGIIPQLLTPITAALSVGCIAGVRDRYELARWLLNAALDFLIFHELGHIALAHLDYFEQVRRSELHAENVAGDDETDQLAIELMADEFAIAAVANRRLSGRYDDRSDIAEFSDEELYDRALLFAIGLIFLLMTPLEALATFAATSHPHPEFRVGVVFALLYEGRSVPDRDVGKKVIADLAKMPAIMGLPPESFLGVYWGEQSDRSVDMNAWNKFQRMFEQNSAAVKRMRPKLDQFRESLARRELPG